MTGSQLVTLYVDKVLSARQCVLFARITRNDDDDEDHRPIIIEFCGRIDAVTDSDSDEETPYSSQNQKKPNPWSKSNDTQGRKEASFKQNKEVGLFTSLIWLHFT